MNNSEATLLGSNTSLSTDNTKESVSGPLNLLQTQREGYLVKNFLYIKDLIQRKISYPAEARKKGWGGSAKVAFHILSSGNVNDIKIIESTGYKILDRNVINAIQEASPFPRPPVEAQIIIPIVYRIQ
jgi:protein TonB